MAVRLAALVSQPDTLVLSLHPTREYRCLPLTCVGGELIERLRAGHKPTLAETRAAVAPHLPELSDREVARLGCAELYLVLHHAAGTDVGALVDALQAAAGAGAAGADGSPAGKAAARQTTARAGRAQGAKAARSTRPARSARR